MKAFNLTILALALLLAAPARVAAETRPFVTPFRTDDPPYLKAVDPSVALVPLLTVGEALPRTSNPVQSYRFIGLPDGMGLFRPLSPSEPGSARLLVNHELAKTVVSQPVAGQPLKTGAFTSEFVISPLGFLSGDYAATTVLDSKTGAPVAGSIGRLCSGFLAGAQAGFDRSVFLTGEEADGDDTFDGRGGLGFALADGVAYPLPDLGRYRKENLVVLPDTGLRTYVVGLEDGPQGLKSQLYLYVGEKKLGSKNPLERNGLSGGRVYVLASGSPDRWDEKHFRKIDRPLAVRWSEVRGQSSVADMKDEAFDTASIAAGSFNFSRIEDGTYDRTQPGVFYFVTTGGGLASTRNGRLYRLTMDPKIPLDKPALLEILLDGDDGDPIVNPDNVDANAAGDLMIQEDFTFAGNLGAGRSPSIWRYRPDSGKLTRLAEIASAPSGLGTTSESSGIIDASAVFGPGSWLVNVQEHGVDSRKASELQKISGDAQLVEGGQILLLRVGP